MGKQYYVNIGRPAEPLIHVRQIKSAFVPFVSCEATIAANNQIALLHSDLVAQKWTICVYVLDLFFCWGTRQQNESTNALWHEYHGCDICSILT